jgi:hypothetical protein
MRGTNTKKLIGIYTLRLDKLSDVFAFRNSLVLMVFLSIFLNSAIIIYFPPSFIKNSIPYVSLSQPMSYFGGMVIVRLT